MFGFENLEVWKRSCRLAVDLYRTLSTCNDAGLKSQMTRAAVSIPSNIAEGYERRGSREYLHFLTIAKGSAGELRTQLYIASSIGAIDPAKVSAMVSELKEISSMLQAIIAKLQER